MQNQSLSFEEKHSQVEPTFEEILYTLIQLQGGEHRNPLDVIEKEIAIIGAKVRQLSQIRKIKINQLRKKIETCQNQACEQIAGAESFQVELQKSLQQSSRECNKRLEKLQRERLQRDIEINSMIDQHILAIAEQNEPTTEVGTQLAQIQRKSKKISQKVQNWNAQLKKKVKQVQSLLDCAFSTQKQSWRSKYKASSDHIIVVKKQMMAVEVKLKSKLESLTQQRQKAERLVLKQFELVIDRFVK